VNYVPGSHTSSHHSDVTKNVNLDKRDSNTAYTAVVTSQMTWGPNRMTDLVGLSVSCSAKR